jgi:uncharacterized membrane-anchored protein
MLNEKIRDNGATIYLELTKNDLKRPLVQGDVINLRYTVAKGLFFDTLYRHGFVVVKLDSNAIASRVRFQQFAYPKAANEFIMEYTKNSKELHIGPEQYFIQQGQSKNFESAKYGALKVDAVGKTLLMGLYDSTLKKIE